MITANRSLHCPCVRWLVPTVIVLAELTLPGSLWAQLGHKQVLALYSTRRDAQISIIGEGDLPRILDDGLGSDLDYYSEFIDVARFPDPAYQSGFGDFVRLKYRGIRFDLVVAMGDVAIEFVNLHRGDLFGDTPLVFLANNRATRVAAKSTGVIVERNLAATLALVELLQPEVRNVFVVSGAAATDKAFENLMRTQTAPFEPRLDFTYLSGLATDELEQRLATLPARSVVYYLLVSQDGAGNKFHPLEYVDRVAAAANAPTYCWVDSAMAHGIVGGSLYEQRQATNQVAQLALRVLRGEPADSIATATADLNARQVDWRQLRRWRIDESRVPVGTEILFREPTIWDLYSVYILGALGILVTQTVLIAGLMILRARRRHAEKELRESQAQLRTSYQRIRDLGARLLNAQEAERSRIARELHDDISQQVSLLAIELAMLRGSDQAQRSTLTDNALSQAEGIVKSVHELSHRLHPVKLRLIGLVGALHELQHEMSQAGAPVIRFTHDDLPQALPHDLSLCLFRIVQEALHNAIKHSRAREISLHLSGTANEIRLSIADDGVGFDVDAAWGKGLGLISMSERLDAIGGTFEIRSTPGAGTWLEVRVPLHISEDDQTVAV